MIDFSQLGLNTMPKLVNPRDIFMGLTQKNAKYQYPRDVQGEVWKQWFELRNNQDNIVKMNTGERVIIVIGAINALISRISGTLNKYISCIA